ncbi:HIRAN domain-containing protein [Amycolatopsis sp. GA6-003]|uniref:HIRAN domain-containing protein n=1 Tax=Amycolatopsis sp. GA6-003 TaxID=2652444 RepID=UPI0039174D3E
MTNRGFGSVDDNEQESLDYSGAEPPKFSDLQVDLVSLSDDGRLGVVGESYYQEALRLVAGGRRIGAGFEEHLPVTAVLVPEPENPWDEDAVRVDVLAGSRTVKVGYLSRDRAAEYQPELLELGVKGVLGTCPARITGGGDKYYGIYLHLAGPGELSGDSEPADAVVAEITASDVLLRNDWSCTVTKEEAHQDVLREYAPTGKRQYREVVASLGFCVIGTGKYRGREAIEVRLGGRRVGQLTYAMTERYRGIVDGFLKQNLEVTCEAFTVLTMRGVEVELRMPRDPNRT